MKFDSPVCELKGIGKKTAETLAAQDITTVRELLMCFPAAYRSFKSISPAADMREGEFSMLKLTVSGKPFFLSRSRARSVFTVYAKDDTSSVKLTFFNQPYYYSLLAPGSQHIFYGKAQLYNEKLCLNNPKVYPTEQENGILPIYPISKVKQKLLRSAISQALAELEERELFSLGFLNAYGLLPLLSELEMLHTPKTDGEYIAAGKSVMFKDFLAEADARSLTEKKGKAPAVKCSEAVFTAYSQLFPFDFTGAQKRTMEELRRDMENTSPMNRLLQGDVGSGKTAVAFYGAYLAMSAGFQSALMAPTELLAAQHYENALSVFKEKAALLTSSSSPSEKRAIAKGLAEGSIAFVIGTHALLYHELSFKALALVITDEQHRFGVSQRSALSGLDPNAHTLIMSATPIPRTLALALFGKIEVSLLDELPGGRIPIKTFIVQEEKRGGMYEWIREKLKSGKQGYVVCPLIEGVDETELRSVCEVYAELSKKLPGINTAFLHGRMKAQEKEEIMRSFKDGHTQLLISTTVIEVGVDVKNADIMVIENAERFGLAALHQLRGRIGRGGGEAFCYLVTENACSERLKMLAKTTDGFEIAQFDLKARGGGQLTGFKQHGSLEPEALNIMENASLFLKAQEALKDIRRSYPDDMGIIREASEKKAERLSRIVYN